MGNLAYFFLVASTILITVVLGSALEIHWILSTILGVGILGFGASIAEGLIEATTNAITSNRVD